jgi:hypothetical protein
MPASDLANHRTSRTTGDKKLCIGDRDAYCRSIHTAAALRLQLVDEGVVNVGCCGAVAEERGSSGVQLSE